MGQLKSYYKILCYYSHRISYPEYWCAPCILWTTRVGATTRLSKGGRDPSSPSRQPSGSCAAPRSVPGSPALPQGTARRPRGPGPPPGCVHSPSRWATSGHEETETPSAFWFQTFLFTLFPMFWALSFCPQMGALVGYPPAQAAHHGPPGPFTAPSPARPLAGFHGFSKFLVSVFSFFNLMSRPCHFSWGLAYPSSPSAAGPC